MNPTDQVQVVVTWAMNLSNGMTAAKRQSFLSFMVGSALQAEPPLSAQTVLTDVVSALPISVFGTLYEIASDTVMPAPAATP